MATRPRKPIAAKAGRILRKHEIPHYAERILVNELIANLDHNNYEFLHTYRLRRRRLWQMTITVWRLHLRDKFPNTQDIARALDQPRSNVARWLKTLQSTGIIGREGTRYYITEKCLVDVVTGHSPSLLDRQINLILDTADALRQIQKK